MQPQKLPNQQQLPKKPSQLYRRRHRKGRVLASILAVVLLAASVLLFYYRQAIVDQITVWRFTPTTELVSFADRAGLNDLGKFYLYASQTQISDKSAFNTACGKLQNERTVVLGCYVGTDRRIYIYNVTDTQLDGVRETTAAHEMLHAAYDRLSESDKDRVDALLKDEESKITDEIGRAHV